MYYVKESDKIKKLGKNKIIKNTLVCNDNSSHKYWIEIIKKKKL